MNRVSRSRSGFTLVELTVVLVVIGVLASIAIPRYRDVVLRAREAEVEPLLRQVLTLEERYRARAGSYTLTLTQLEGGGSLPESGEYYSFTATDHASGVCIVASPNAAGVSVGVRARSLDAARTFYENDSCS